MSVMRRSVVSSDLLYDVDVLKVELVAIGVDIQAADIVGNTPSVLSVHLGGCR